MVTQASLFGFYFGVSAVHSAHKQKLLCLKALVSSRVCYEKSQK